MIIFPEVVVSRLKRRFQEAYS